MRHADRIHHVTFIMIALSMVAMILIIPPYQGSDESAHFMRAYALTKGESFRGITNRDVYFPDVIINWWKTFPIKASGCGGDLGCPGGPFFTTDKEVDWLRHGSKVGSSHEGFGWAGMRSYTPISHMMPAIGVWLGKHVTRMTGVWFLLARLFNVLGAIALGWLAFRTTRRGRPYILIAMAVPCFVGSAAVVTSDMPINGLALFCLALTIRFLETPNIALSRLDMRLLYLSLLLCLMKFGYFLVPIIPLTAAVVAGKADLRQLRPFLIAYGACTVAAFVWILTAGAMDVNAGAGTGVAAQAHLLSRHPARFFEAVGNALQRWWSDYFASMIGWRSWGGGTTPAMPLQFCYFGLIIAASLVLGRALGAGLNRRICRQLTLASFAMAIPTFLIIFGVLYLDWSPTGDRIVEGINGRYFYPLLIFMPAASMVLANIRPRADARPETNRLMTVLAVAALANSYLLLYRTYLFYYAT